MGGCGVFPGVTRSDSFSFSVRRLAMRRPVGYVERWDIPCDSGRGKRWHAAGCRASRLVCGWFCLALPLSLEASGGRCGLASPGGISARPRRARTGDTPHRDQGPPLQYTRIEQTVQASPADRRDQPLLLIATQRGSRKAGTPRTSVISISLFPLDLKST